MRPRLFTLIALLALLATFGACRCNTIPAVKGEPRTEIPEVMVAKVGGDSITVDGALDDPGWSQSEETPGFVAPGDGAFLSSSPVNARARMAWTDEAFYVAVTVNDAAPTSPFGRDDVDPHIWSKSSGIELMLQPGDPGDNRQYFELQVDVNEAVWDTRFDDYNTPITMEHGGKRFGHQDWDAKLERAVSVDQKAGLYTVEMKLPWSALGNLRVPAPPNPGDTWRVNLYSFRDGQKQSLAWSPIMGKGNFHKTSQFGRVTFK